MRTRPFAQVDVFSAAPLRGNPVAVVLDGDGVSDEDMQAFARWTNLSETTFVLPAADPAADYRLRIFTPGGELPFAGHPTLGSAHAWLEAGGTPRQEGALVQECGIGLVQLRVEADGIAFDAPPLLRSGPATDEEAAAAVEALGVDRGRVLDVQWADNGPGWIAVLVDSAATVLGLTPDFAAMGSLKVGAAGRHPEGGPADWEVRAFVPGIGVPEDPVTGSLNAGLARWFLSSGLADHAYTARQGTALGRDGRVTVTPEGDSIWVGGASTTLIRGTVTL
ncbi:PhzF family phenazine biosynthesis protein [Naasia aerilata]|uniref:Phenazine biosynthesis protein PhzF n=1 Tax=Naasia aerilata TaxID=1162966 RepID=A0ABM8GC61_9MICO|nr:PhzF family phenazine biosynthesis protein [Naasia aerilata]BDZ45821.1 phenazine biosynthesis protein PhzF [Naasia aerilata]